MTWTRMIWLIGHSCPRHGNNLHKLSQQCFKRRKHCILCYKASLKRMFIPVRIFSTNSHSTVRITTMFNQWLSSFLSYPVIPFALSLSICVLVLGFTSENSALRALGLIPMLGCMQLALRIVQIKNNTTNQLYMSMLMGSTVSMVIQYLDSVLLSRWSYEAQGPTSALGGQTELRTLSGAAQQEGERSAGIIFRRLVFGWEETFRARSTRTPWEVKNVPKFFPDRPEMVPTRAQFLYLSARRCLISLFIVDVISFIGRDTISNSINFA